MSLTPNWDDCYFISAGEFSGDLLAADLVYALRAVFPGMQPIGIAGEAMQRAGVTQLVSHDQLNVMGVWDVMKRLPDLRRLESYVIEKVAQMRPRFAVLVDYPGLHFRLAEELRLLNVPVFQYVAPKLWAWGKGRMGKLKQDFTRVYGVLPFEQDFFSDAGVAYKFVGSPHKDRCEKISLARETFGLKKDYPIVAILPGSRKSELQRIMPRLLKIKDAITTDFPQVQFVLPLAQSLTREELLETMHVNDRQLSDSPLFSQAKRWGNVHILPGMSLEAVAVADFAVVASGTATLECALLGVPMAVVYVMDDFSYQIALDKVDLPYYSLVNLVAGREIVPEYIQNFSDNDVAHLVCDFIRDRAKADHMVGELHKVQDQLSGGAALKVAQDICFQLKGEHGGKSNHY